METFRGIFFLRDALLRYDGVFYSLSAPLLLLSCICSCFSRTPFYPAEGLPYVIGVKGGAHRGQIRMKNRGESLVLSIMLPHSDWSCNVVILLFLYPPLCSCWRLSHILSLLRYWLMFWGITWVGRTVCLRRPKDWKMRFLVLLDIIVAVFPRLIKKIDDYELQNAWSWNLSIECGIFSDLLSVDYFFRRALCHP